MPPRMPSRELYVLRPHFASGAKFHTAPRAGPYRFAHRRLTMVWRGVRLMAALPSGSPIPLRVTVPIPRRRERNLTGCR